MKVGDYVRTKEFGINRVEWFDKGEPILENGFTALQEDYKSSPNIIDLIEVGDYVNGYKVISIGINDNHKNIELYVANQGYDELVLEQDIKSIVTKEQFESMEYKVGE